MKPVLVAATLVLIGIIPCAAKTAAKKLDYPPKAFDALYDQTSALGTSSYREVSDGKGHVRIENNMILPGHKHHIKLMVLLEDYPKRQLIVLDSVNKVAHVKPMAPSQSGAPIDKDRIKELAGKSLGVKVIDGHPCHGWEYDDGGKTQVWFGDDTGCEVQFTTEGQNGTQTQHLRKYDPLPQNSAALFAPPPDYKIQNELAPPANASSPPSGPPQLHP